jgi:hypothetical protein
VKDEPYTFNKTCDYTLKIELDVAGGAFRSLYPELRSDMKSGQNKQLLENINSASLQLLL